MFSKQRWALFISGQGSNMSALIDQKQNAANIQLVVSSSDKSYGLLRAKRNGIATFVLEKKILWSDVLNVLDDQQITHIFLLGFMRVLPTTFLEKWQKPILNVHPSLLPEYPGLDSIRRALIDKKAIGVTVHKVTSVVDAGDIVFQKVAVPEVKAPSQVLTQVEERVHYAEYELVRKSFKVASCWM